MSVVTRMSGGALPQASPPQVTPETAHFWEGASRGELLLQCCACCGSRYFPPRPVCPQCTSREVAPFRASGRGAIYTFTVVLRGLPDGPRAPYLLAVVELEEGPRMLTRIVGCPPSTGSIRIGDSVHVEFEPQGLLFVPVFRPKGVQ